MKMWMWMRRTVHTLHCYIYLSICHETAVGIPISEVHPPSMHAQGGRVADVVTSMCRGSRNTSRPPCVPGRVPAVGVTSQIAHPVHRTRSSADRPR